MPDLGSSRIAPISATRSSRIAQAAKMRFCVCIILCSPERNSGPLWWLYSGRAKSCICSGRLRRHFMSNVSPETPGLEQLVLESSTQDRHMSLTQLSRSDNFPRDSYWLRSAQTLPRVPATATSDMTNVYVYEWSRNDHVRTVQRTCTWQHSWCAHACYESNLHCTG